MHNDKAPMRSDCRRLRLLLVAAAAWATGSGVLAQAPTAPMRSDQAGAHAARALDESDRKFIEDAAHGGIAEVELGRMAQQRATDPQVKAFGERMVADHGKANLELKRLVASTGVALPTQPTREQQNHADHLARLSGSQFDFAYMKHMVDDHQKDVAAFDKAARTLADPELKAFATQTLPVLQAHLQQARTTYDTLRKQPASKAKAAPR